MKQDTHINVFAAPYDWVIHPMTEQDDYDIAQWKYDGIYAFYNRVSMPPFPQTPSKFIEDAFAVRNGTGELIGHFHFGVDAQIPTVEDDVYSSDYLDIGLGLRPDLCGHGLGVPFVQAGLSFGLNTYHTNNFRLSVAQFNERAVRVYEKVGFLKVREVTNSHFNNSFFIMINSEGNV